MKKKYSKKISKNRNKRRYSKRRYSKRRYSKRRYSKRKKLSRKQRGGSDSRDPYYSSPFGSPKNNPSGRMLTRHDVERETKQKLAQEAEFLRLQKEREAAARQKSVREAQRRAAEEARVAKERMRAEEVALLKTRTIAGKRSSDMARQQRVEREQENAAAATTNATVGNVVKDQHRRRLNATQQRKKREINKEIKRLKSLGGDAGIEAIPKIQALEMELRSMK